MLKVAHGGPILTGARTGDDGEGYRQIHQESTLSATRPRESKVQAASKRQSSAHDHLLFYVHINYIHLKFKCQTYIARSKAECLVNQLKFIFFFWILSPKHSMK